MKIQWLGTAAAEGWPAVFCQCAACREAERRGGRDIRTRSGALIDGVLLIDANPDLYHQKLTLGLDLGGVRDIVITHNHSDHFHTMLFWLLNPVAAHRGGAEPMRIHASAAVLEGIEDAPHYTLHRVEHGETFAASGYHITALPAVHGAPMSQFFLIERDGAALLYAHDTDLFSDEIWAILAEAVRAPLGLVSMDCTNGPLPHSYTGHMGFDDNVTLKDMLLERGLADEKTRFVSTHFSHNGRVLYDESVKRMTPHGIDVAYDGMVITVE